MKTNVTLLLVAAATLAAIKLTGYAPDLPWLVVVTPVLLPLGVWLVLSAVALIVSGVITAAHAIKERSGK